MHGTGNGAIARRTQGGRARGRSAWILAGVASIALAIGCASTGGWGGGHPEPPPTEGELALLRQENVPYQAKGTAAIAGQVVLRTTTGELPARGKTPVYLTPVTTLSRSRFQARVVERNELPERLRAQIWWTAETDANGNFRFVALPPGDYYLVSPVAWSPSGSAVRTDVAFAVARLAPGQDLAVTVIRDTRS